MQGTARTKSWWLGLSIVVLSCLIYLNALDNSFHYDDSHSIVENYHIRNIAQVPQFFVDPQTFSREPAMAMYRPLLVTTYAVNYQLGRYNPKGYRLVNMVLHAFAALAVFAILCGLLGRDQWAWWGAALFALHPIHSQAVNYISSRAELLGALSVLVAFYLAIVRRAHWAWGGGGYVLGLLGKSTAIALLPLLLLGVLLRPTAGRWWRLQIPYWAATAVYLVLIVANGFLTKSLAQDVRPYGDQLYTQIKALVYYLKLLAMPVDLSIEHAFAVSQSLAEGAVLASLAFIISLCFLTYCACKRLSASALGSGWVFAGLGLTFFVPLNVLVNEHRLYLASIGVIWIVLWHLHKQQSTIALRLCGLTALLILGGLTWQRNVVWFDEQSLWRNAVQRAPNMFRAQSNLGLAHYQSGALDSALIAYNRAVELNPNYSKTWNNLGLVYEGLGQFDKAKAAYAHALSLRADLAGTYGNLGRLLASRGDVANAEDHLNKALRIDPYNIEAMVNLGLVYQRSGRQEEAEHVYQRALTVQPDFAQAHNNLGLLYAAQGKVQEALVALERATQLEPEYVEAQINLQLQKYKAQGRPARQAYEHLLLLYPQRLELWQGAASARAAAGHLDAAIEACRKILELDPGNEQAQLNLQKLLDARRSKE